MADEIKIPCRVWPSRDENQNGSYDHFSLTEKKYIAEGIRCPTAVDTDLFFRMTAPIPTAIDSTPAGQIWITFIPLAASSAVVLKVSLFSITPGENVDPVSFDDEFQQAITIGGSSGIEQTQEFGPISSATEASLDVVAGRIQRLGTEAGDSNTGDIGIVQVLYVADKTS